MHNHIHVVLKDVIPDKFAYNFSDSLAKPPLKLGHGLVVAWYLLNY